MKPTRLAQIHHRARTRRPGRSVVVPVDRTPKERLITVWDVIALEQWKVPAVQQVRVYDCLLGREITAADKWWFEREGWIETSSAANPS